MKGYNTPGSRVWHRQQRCGGTFFPGVAEMSDTVARNRGIRPCDNCCDGEWPGDDR